MTDWIPAGASADDALDIAERIGVFDRGGEAEFLAAFDARFAGLDPTSSQTGRRAILSGRAIIIRPTLAGSPM
jgi:hypothetical protein